MKQTALITGASSGIGRALAGQFAQHGYDVVLVARRADALERVASDIRAATGGAQVMVVAADLGQPHSGGALVEQLRGAGVQLDVVVNNAGFGLQGEFAVLSLEQQVEMVQLNVLAVTELTRLVLPGMLERKRGGILNVASTAAFQPGPLMSVYYATKAYVLSLTEGIAEEVAGTGVKVTCLCPGPTETGFAERAAVTGTNLFKRAVMDAEAVAREGFDGWNDGQVVVIPGSSNRRGALVVRFAPRAVVRRIVKRLNSQAS